MKVKVFTLRPDPESGAFVDPSMESFFTTTDAIDVTDHVLPGLPALLLVVRYRESGVAPRQADAPIVVEDEHRHIFEALRSWRNTRAKRDGKPAYVLFTNAQLLAIARARPSTRAAIAALPGVGEARLRDYADELLALLAAHAAG